MSDVYASTVCRQGVATAVAGPTAGHRRCGHAAQTVDRTSGCSRRRLPRDASGCYCFCSPVDRLSFWTAARRSIDGRQSSLSEFGVRETSELYRIVRSMTCMCGLKLYTFQDLRQSYLYIRVARVTGSLVSASGHQMYSSVIW